ncbi:MAG: recombination protein NinB [Burkholderiaceae bacterium]
MTELIARSPKEAHAAVQDIWAEAKALTLQGRAVRLVVAEQGDDRSLAQHKRYWAILTEIAEKAKASGAVASPEGWHWYMKQKFLGYTFEKVKLPFAKRTSVRRTLKSTTALSVKAFSEYMEKVEAHAATDFGVVFEK